MKQGARNVRRRGGSAEMARPDGAAEGDSVQPLESSHRDIWCTEKKNLGAPTGNRTRVSNVTGLCAHPYTMGACFKVAKKCFFNPPFTTSLVQKNKVEII